MFAVIDMFLHNHQVVSDLDNDGGTTEAAKNKKSKKPSSASLNVTGQLGDVMKESSSVAWTYSKQHLSTE